MGKLPLSKVEPDPKSLVQINVSDLLGTSAALDRLAKAIIRGVGGFLYPWHRSRTTQADITSASQFFSLLGERGLKPESADLDLSDRSMLHVSARNVRRQERSETIAALAIEQTEHQPGPPDGPGAIDMSDDWIDHFWN